MAIQSLTDLKALINSTIQDNTTNDISGSDVQTALINAIDTLDSLEGFINVHKANGQTTITAYGSKALARAAVPDDCKKEGVVIAYKISTGWLIEQNLDATAGTWGDDASWQTIGPVSVSQNTQTDSDGNGTITVGGTEKGKFAGADKLIELVAIVETQADLNVGDIYYNSRSDIKKIRKKTGEGTYIDIPFYKGAIYKYNNQLYVWNGNNLVTTDGIIQRNINAVFQRGTIINKYPLLSESRKVTPSSILTDKILKRSDSAPYYSVEDFASFNVYSYNVNDLINNYSINNKQLFVQGTGLGIQYLYFVILDADSNPVYYHPYIAEDYKYLFGKIPVPIDSRAATILSSFPIYAFDDVLSDAYEDLAESRDSFGSNFGTLIDVPSFTRNILPTVEDTDYAIFGNKYYNINGPSTSDLTAPLKYLDLTGDIDHFYIDYYSINFQLTTPYFAIFLIMDANLNILYALPADERPKIIQHYYLSNIKKKYPTAKYLLFNIPSSSAFYNSILTSISEQNKNHWKNKVWYAYGTSITSISMGKYVPYLAQLGEFGTTVNKGIAGGGIGDLGGYSHGQVYDAICNITDGKTDADLITLETCANDTGADVPLGTIYDTGQQTLAGCLNDCLRYLQAHTNAQIAVMPSPALTSLPEMTNKYYEWRKMIKEICELNNVYYISPSDNLGYGKLTGEHGSDYVIDNIHQTELGGYNLAKCMWSQIKNIPLFYASLPN